MDMSVPQQRDVKLQLVREVFRGIAASSLVSFHPCQSPTAYRNRIRLRVNEAGVPGFFNAAKSPTCAVLEPGLRDALQALQRECERDSELLRGARHLELRAADLDGRFGVLVTWPMHASTDAHQRCQRLSGLAGRLNLELLVDSQLVREPMTSARSSPGSKVLQRIGLTRGVYQWVPLDGFMQVNSVINRALIEAVVEGALERQLSSVVDLYCGAGNFSLVLSQAGLSVTGIEQTASSIDAVRRASLEQGCSGRYFCGDVGALLEAELLPQLQQFDLAVVDPPRAGLVHALEPLAALQPRFIAMCSCNPRSLKRDVEALLTLGYTLQSLSLFDMFCHTDHVEVLVWLERRRPSRRESPREQLCTSSTRSPCA